MTDIRNGKSIEEFDKAIGHQNPPTIDKFMLVDDEEALEIAFTYHNDPEAVPHYNAINDAAKHLARTIMAHCPVSPDRTHALRVVRDARMWANAAIACKGVVLR